MCNDQTDNVKVLESKSGCGTAVTLDFILQVTVNGQSKITISDEMCHENVRE
jgi:hypothetical protein